MVKRRALVTGGAGSTSSRLCERLLLEGYEVVCMDNLLTGTLENVAHFLLCVARATSSSSSTT